MKNYTVLVLSLKLASTEFILSPVLNLDFKSPEGETGEIQSPIPLTLLNFHEPLEISVDECRDFYKNVQNKELLTKISNSEIPESLGKLPMITRKLQSCLLTSSSRLQGPPCSLAMSSK